MPNQIPKTALEYFKIEKNKQTKPHQRFYDEAIAALEQVNSFQNGNSCGVEGGTFQNGNDHSKEEHIECEASAPEVRHGEWLRQNGGFFFLCSNCGKAAATKGNFCHNCGADMRGTGNA